MESQKLREKYKQIINGELSNETIKKRRISRTFLIIDIVLLIFIFIFISKNSGDTIYKTHDFELNNTKIRFDVLYKKGNPDIIVSLTLNNQGEDKIIKQNNIANITIFAHDKMVEQYNMNEIDDKIILKKGKPYILSISVPVEQIIDYAKKENLINTKKYLISFNYIPVEIKLNMNIFGNYSSKLKLNLEVK